MIEFFVSGKPVPQGSMKVFNGRPIHQNAISLAAWRADIARTARIAGCQPKDAPVWIYLVFNMQAPKTVARKYPTVKPDLDKLVRGVLDGLSGVAYEDDSQVIRITATKVYDKNLGVQIGVQYI